MNRSIKRGVGVFLLGALVLFSIWPAPSGEEQGPSFEAGPCSIGVYSRGGDSFVAVTAVGEEFRYTFSDGVTGQSDDGTLVCGDGAVRLQDGTILPQVPIVQTDTQFESHGVVLVGQLLEPPEAGPDTPLVVYAHGSESVGWLGRARDPYQLVGRGVSVFVYDKRGTGLSGGAYTQNFPRLADDLVAASQEAKRLAAGRYGRFGLIGLSQGGWIAPLAADRVDADFIGIGYGLVVDIREEDAAEVELDLRQAGYGDEVVAQALTITDATARIVSSGYQDGLEDLDAARERFRDEPWYDLVQGSYTGTLLTMSTDDLRENGIPFYDSLEIDWSLDPVEVLRDVAVPQLWALAAEDREAPIDLTIERLSMLRNEGQDIAMYLFPDTDHGMWEFDEAEDGTRDFTRITDGFYDLMADWAKGELAGQYVRASILDS